MCPFCGSLWVTFAKKRGTFKCNACGILNATKEEYARWSEPNLVLNEAELVQVRHSCVGHPQAIIVKRLLATLDATRV